MRSQRSPKALFVTQHYWPEIIGSAPYCTDIADSLAAGNTKVTVFTCWPHYPEAAIPQSYLGGQRDNEKRGDIVIKRVAPWLPRRRNVLGRLFAEFLFLVNGLAALTTRRIHRSDLVVSLCPSILTVLLGVFATRRKGRHIAVVHDIQSGLASGLGMVGSGPLVKLMRWLERVVLNRVSLVLVLSRNMGQRLEDQGIRTPIEQLPIWVDTKVISPREKPESETVHVYYSGNFGKKQALDQVVEMAALLEKRNDRIVVTFRGGGGEAGNLAENISARGLRNVRFAPLVPADRLAEGLAEGDIYVVPQNGQTADFAVPSKVYSIMAAGRPFVASAPPGSMLWWLKDESHALLCVPAGDAAALADAVERLVRNPALRRELARNGRNYAVAHHDKTIFQRRFLAMAQNGYSERSGRDEHTISPSRP